MRSREIRTLTRWEAGELSAEDAERQHPGASTLIAVHQQLTSLSADPLPASSIDRAALEAMLPDRIEDVRDTRARRVITIAIAAATLSASSVAYAAGVEPVRRTVDTIVDRIGDMLTGSEPATDPSGEHEPRADEPEGTGSEADAPRTSDGRGEAPDGDRESGNTSRDDPDDGSGTDDPDGDEHDVDDDRSDGERDEADDGEAPDDDVEPSGEDEPDDD